jgi:opacity protein-like surface antigen
MTRIGKLTIAVAVPLVALAGAAQAQLAGIPVYFNARGGTGVGVAANVGFPDNKSGGGTAYGVAGSLGTGPVTLTAMVGAYKPSAVTSAQASFGGSVSYRVLGGGFLPVAVAVQGGYGTFKALGITRSTIPVGVGIEFNVPLFPLKPWIAPRWEYTSVSGGGIPSVNASSFRVSAGVNFNLLLGLGLHAAVDYGQVPSKINPAKPNTLTFGVGAHFNFHVPMM